MISLSPSDRLLSAPDILIWKWIFGYGLSKPLVAKYSDEEAKLAFRWIDSRPAAYRSIIYQSIRLRSLAMKRRGMIRTINQSAYACAALNELALALRSSIPSRPTPPGAKHSA